MAGDAYRANEPVESCPRCRGPLGKQPAFSKDGVAVCRRCEADLAIEGSAKEIREAGPEIPVPVVATGIAGIGLVGCALILLVGGAAAFALLRIFL